MKPLSAVRVALALATLGAVGGYFGTEIHTHANIVDLEVLPNPAVRADSEPVPVEPRDLPNKQVRTHIDFYPEGGPGCSTPSRETGDPALDIGRRAEIGTRFDICFGGFDNGRPVVLRVDGPGFQLRKAVRPTVWSWNVGVGTPPGRYRISASQNHLGSIEGHTRVLSSKVPFVRVRSLDGYPGSTFEIIVGGGPKKANARVHLYRAVEPSTPRRNYLSTVPVMTDRNGNGSAIAHGTGGSTHTCYAVAPGFRGYSHSENQFCFSPPDR